MNSPEDVVNSPVDIDEPAVVTPGQTAIPSIESRVGKVVFFLSLIFGVGGFLFLVLARPFETLRYTNLHVGLGLLIFFVLDTYRRGDPSHWSRLEWVIVVAFGAFTLAGFLGHMYIEVYYDVIAYERFGRFPRSDYVAGVSILLAVLIATKRAFGWPVAGVYIITLLFARYGTYFPGMLNHQGLSWRRIITMSTVEFNGIFHLIVQIGATWILIFVLWAGIVEEMGGLETVFDIGFLIGAKFRSGIAQTAVVASMIMGSITGSPMANAAVTGSFTIPLMKERGLHPEKAGAIEAVASTGGMILPPIMGSVAFIMASFLQTSYATIVMVATLPALLFYGSVALSVHLIVIRSKVDMNVDREIDKRKTFFDSLPLVISLAVLLFTLVILRYPVGIAGSYTIVTLFAAALVVNAWKKRNIVSGTKKTMIETARGFRTGSVRMVPITVVLAAMGVVISAFNITGTGFRLSMSIVNFAAGNILLLLILVMLASIVLGLGMPAVAAYVLTITLVAPAMVEVGFERMTAHFFVFYFAMLATITPPVALGPAVTSQIAETDFVRTAIRAMKIGIPLFLIPYIFAFNEALLGLEGVDTVVAFVTAMVGIILINVSLFVDFEGRLTSALGSRTNHLSIISYSLKFVLFIASFLVIFVPAFIV